MFYINFCNRSSLVLVSTERKRFIVSISGTKVFIKLFMVAVTKENCFNFVQED